MHPAQNAVSHNEPCIIYGDMTIWDRTCSSCRRVLERREPSRSKKMTTEQAIRDVSKAAMNSLRRGYV
jgi:hypothetical protein